MQLRALKIKNVPNLQRVYAKFFIHEDIDSDDAIKMVDLTGSKHLDVATELKLMEYKIAQG